MTARRRIGWSVLGAGSHAVGQFGFLVLVARHRPLDEVGLWGLALAVLAPIDLFFRGNGRIVAATSGDTSMLARWLPARSLLALALVATAIVVAAVFQVVTGQGAALVVTVSIVKAIDGIADFAHGEMQRRDQYGRIAAAQATRASALLLAGVALRHVPLEVALAGLSICSAMVLARIELHSLRRGISAADWGAAVRDLREFTKRYLGFGLASSASSLHAVVPRVLLGAYSGLGDVALLTTANYASVALGRIGVIVSAVVAPHLGREVSRQGVRYAIRTSTMLAVAWLFVGVFGAIAVMTIANGAMSAVFGPGYRGGAAVLALLVIAVGVEQAGLVAGFVLTALARGAVAGRAAMLSTIAVVGVAVVLIPGYGAVGAAIAALFATVVSAAALWVGLSLSTSRAEVKAP